MPTYLCAWNPKLFEWTDLDDSIEQIGRNGYTEDKWSVANRKIKPRDRVFLFRQGPDRPGLVGAGHFVSEPYEGEHWGDTDKTAWYADIRFEQLFNPDRDEILTRDALMDSDVAEIRWNTQSSGIRIPDDLASRLEKIWTQFLLRPAKRQSLKPRLFVVETSGSYQLKTRDSVETVRLGDDLELSVVVNGKNRRLRLLQIFEDSDEVLEGEAEDWGFISLRRLPGDASPAKASGSARQAPRWNEQSFLGALAETSGAPAASAAKKILEWCKVNTLTIRWNDRAEGSFIPILTLDGRSHRCFRFSTGGQVTVRLFASSQEPPFDDAAQRRELLRRLNEIEGVHIAESLLTGKPNFPISVLEKADGLQAFLSTFDWFVMTVRSHTSALRGA